MISRLTQPLQVAVKHLLFNAVLLGGIITSSGQSSPVAVYTFDDSTANDSSGNALHGTLVGSAQIVTNNTRPFAPAGNRVLSLDGVDLDTNSSYVNLGSPAQLNFSGGNATFAAWVFIDVTKSHHTIFSQGEWKRAVGLTIKGQKDILNIGYSYDITISKLGPGSGGSHEFSLVYSWPVRNPRKPPKDKMVIPCPDF